MSAATDVFALGVIATESWWPGPAVHEGAAPFDLEQAVLSGCPAPLELRPLARVIDRCLARSPFERFPTPARWRDALDAALRLSPLAGGKRDVAERVTAALEHIARINEQQPRARCRSRSPARRRSARPGRRWAAAAAARRAHWLCRRSRRHGPADPPSVSPPAPPIGTPCGGPCRRAIACRPS
ncbi:MAG: hypothetical protein HS111_11600 [Kofleriaceae bacterium]|nr:hypothetical protein [Kofleriaceae bacterium]